MKLRFMLPILLSASTVVSANEYQTFTSLDYTKIETSYGSYDGYNLGAQYFFDKKSTLGPLGEFEFINKTSNIYGSYMDFENNSDTAFGGEYFAGSFLIGAHTHSDDDKGLSSLTLGYLINENFMVKVYASDPFEGDSNFTYQAQYNHQLDGDDYVGFGFTADDDFDYLRYSSTYFTKLQGDKYLKLGFDYADDKYESSWSANASYYFNKMTSVSATLDKENDYSIGVDHFFNETYSIGASYLNGNDYVRDIYQINFSARF